MTPIRVLLVDDSLEFLKSAAHFLTRDQQIVLVGSVCSGREAIMQAAELQPDLILIDLAMPGLSGLETTRQIKAFKVAPRIVIMTLYDTTEYRDAASEVQADGFIAKSAIGVQLFPLIDSLFPKSVVSEFV